MEKNFDRLFYLQIGSSSIIDKLNFTTYGLDALFSLKGVQLNKPNLRPATRFWDPKFHIYRFYSTLKELCPIRKEFEVLVGISKRNEAIYLAILNGYMKFMAFLLEVHRDTLLPKHQGSSIRLRTLQGYILLLVMLFPSQGKVFICYSLVRH